MISREHAPSAGIALGLDRPAWSWTDLTLHTGAYGRDIGTDRRQRVGGIRVAVG
jgi:hypothetical protein